MADFNALFRLQGINNQEPREITVTPKPFVIGRSGDNDLALAHSQISRQHARIFFKDDQYWIEDLNSSNGAWVNDARLRPSVPQIIRPGDVIRMGPFVLTYLRALTAPPPLPTPPIHREELPVPPPVPQETPVLPASAEQSPEAATITHADDASENGEPANDVEKVALDAALAAYKIAEDSGLLPRSGPLADIINIATGGQEYITDDGTRTNGGSGNGSKGSNGSNGSQPPTYGGAGAIQSPDRYPIGIPRYRSSWLDFLPAIYADDEFLGRYLLIQESILSPIIWMIDNMDLYFAPEVAPSEWLRWMASWFDLLIIPDLPIERQRAIMGQIGWLFLRRGTRAGLERLLELYFGVRPEIVENRDEACHFVVTLPLSHSDNRIGREVAERLIAAHKPAFASHTLEIT